MKTNKESFFNKLPSLIQGAFFRISIRAAVKTILVLSLLTPVLGLAYWKASDLYINFSKTDEYVENLCAPAMTRRLMCFCFHEYGRACPGYEED